MTLINIRSVERILLNLNAWIYSIEFFYILDERTYTGNTSDHP